MASVENLPERSGRLPPQDVDAERSVLGAMLLDEGAASDVLSLLGPDDFYRPAHARVFESMQQLFEKNEPLDEVTVVAQLRATGQLEGVGGATYLATLTQSVPTAANAAHYARIVRDRALSRRLINAATVIAGQGYEGGEIDMLLDEAESKIFEITRAREHRGFTSLKEAVKTAFALNVGLNAAIRSKTPVAVFSLEMSKEQLVMRMLCSEARIDAQRLRSGFLKESDWPKLAKSAGLLAEAPVYIDDSGAIGILEMRAKARRLQADKGLGMIIVDYLQLMRGRSGAEGREREISEISRGLKALAKELGVPVIALSQLNRSLEQRTDKRPMLSDLRESGAIEQDADVICFVYRDDYYDPNSADKGLAEIIVGKQRNGPTDTIKLRFFKEYTRFDRAAPRDGQG